VNAPKTNAFASLGTREAVDEINRDFSFIATRELIAAPVGNRPRHPSSTLGKSLRWRETRTLSAKEERTLSAREERERGERERREQRGENRERENRERENRERENTVPGTPKARGSLKGCAERVNGTGPWRAGFLCTNGKTRSLQEILLLAVRGLMSTPPSLAKLRPRDRAQKSLPYFPRSTTMLSFFR
jgi:hypothetical protein